MVRSSTLRLLAFPPCPYTTLFRSETEDDDRRARPERLSRGRPAPVRGPRPRGRRPPSVRRGGPPRRPMRRSDPRWSDRKSTRLNSSHNVISYAGFCLTKNTVNHVI